MCIRHKLKFRVYTCFSFYNTNFLYIYNNTLTNMYGESRYVGIFFPCIINDKQKPKRDVTMGTMTVTPAHTNCYEKGVLEKDGG